MKFRPRAIKQGSTVLLGWAKSEAQFKKMLSEGWEVAEQRVTHHHYWSVLLVRPDDLTEMG